MSCGFSQCTVPRSTVPFPMTSPYMGRGVIFFLLKLFFTHDSRTLPGFALPGVSTTLLFGDQLAVCDVRQSCDVLFHAPRGGRAARYRENRAVQPSRTPDKKHANGAVCRPLPKKKQGQQKEATPLCPSANSSAPHAQQIPKTVALVLRCRVEMLTIVKVKAWSRRPAI